MVRGMCRDWMISIRRACGALDFDRSTYHYTSRRADQAGLERRIREICEIRVRYGYRRVDVLLEREGWGTNIKRTYQPTRAGGAPQSGRLQSIPSHSIASWAAVSRAVPSAAEGQGC